MNKVDPMGLFEQPPIPPVPNPDPRPPSPRQPRPIQEPPQEWDSFSDECKDALKTAMPAVAEGRGALQQRIAAVNRAKADMEMLKKAATTSSIDWRLLAAIGIRETGYRNIKQSDGEGRGIFQIDIGAHPDVTEEQALDKTWAAGWAANLLGANYSELKAKFPDLTPAQLLQATAASYNFGTDDISGNPNTIDVGTSHNNYGSNVVGLMDCFL